MKVGELLLAINAFCISSALQLWLYIVIIIYLDKHKMEEVDDGPSIRPPQQHFNEERGRRGGPIPVRGRNRPRDGFDPFERVPFPDRGSVHADKSLVVFQQFWLLSLKAPPILWWLWPAAALASSGSGDSSASRPQRLRDYCCFARINVSVDYWKM